VRTILLAEDEEALAETLAEIITSMGHQVLVAHDGREALRLAKAHRPDLIISDYMMPVRNGVELLEDVTADPDLASVPFVLVSAAAAPRSAKERAWKFLPKPVRLESLEAVISEAVARPAANGDAPKPVAASAPEPASLREETLNWVAHEIRTPLSTARLTSEMLRRTLAERGDDLLRAKVDLVLRQLNVIGALVHSVLEAARLTENRMQLDLARGDLRAVVDATVDEWREMHPDVTFEVRAPAAPVTVVHDVVRVRQILSNLLSNAVKYGGDAKRVDVTVEEKAATVAIAVRDEGIGIPAAELPRMFQRFHRVAGNGGEGHGLGLFIASSLARLHRGTLGVRSEPGRGSTFTLELPRV
jgi:two-component system, sensor histidine kinase and response regulator